MDPASSLSHVISWIKKPEHLFLVLILLASLIIRWDVSVTNAPLAEWWDSADYMMGAKEFAGIVDLQTYELNPRRPFFLSVFWGILLWLGGNDTTLHLSVLVFSLLSIYFTYRLGKKLANGSVGLIAAALLAMMWNHIFHTGRLLTDIIALSFWLMAADFFWSGYVEGKKRHFIYAGIAMGFAVFTRAASLIMLVPLLLVMVLREKKKILASKKAWALVLLILLVLSPFIIWLFATFDNPIQKFTGLGGGEQRFSGRFQFKYLWLNLAQVGNSIFSPQLAAKFISPTIAGFVVIVLAIALAFDAFIGLDLLWKGNQDLLKKAFLVVWMLTPYVFYSLAGAGVEDR